MGVADPPQQATVAFSARQISSIRAGSSVAIFSTSCPRAIVERLSKLVTHALGNPSATSSSTSFESPPHGRRAAPRSAPSCSIASSRVKTMYGRRPCATVSPHQTSPGLGRSPALAGSPLTLAKASLGLLSELLRLGAQVPPVVHTALSSTEGTLGLLFRPCGARSSSFSFAVTYPMPMAGERSSR